MNFPGEGVSRASSTLPLPYSFAHENFVGVQICHYTAIETDFKLWKQNLTLFFCSAKKGLTIDVAIFASQGFTIILLLYKPLYIEVV